MRLCVCVTPVRDKRKKQLKNTEKYPTNDVCFTLNPIPIDVG